MKKAMNPKCETCDNNDCWIRKHASIEWQSLVSSQKNVIEIKSGQKAIYQGSSATGIYFIYRGKFKIFEESNKQAHILRLAKRGDIMGHRGYGNNYKYPISATALVDSTLCFVPTEVFFKTVKANPELSFNLMMYFACELSQSEIKQACERSASAKSNVINAIFWLTDIFGFDENDTRLINVPVNRRDLSAMTGLRYETLLRVLSDLSKKAIISYKGQKFKILNLDALKES